MNKNNNNELFNKVINLCFSHSIEESYSYLKFLDNQVKIYKSHLDFLENIKPFFFQKRKLIEHNKKKEEYENKIKDIYIKMEQEIYELENSIQLKTP